jgi:hypothetical protein
MTETGEGDAPVRDGPLAALTRPLAIVGGLIMLAAAIMVVVSVGMRWLIRWSVPGDIELVQTASVAADIIRLSIVILIPSLALVQVRWLN